MQSEIDGGTKGRSVLSVQAALVLEIPRFMLPVYQLGTQLVGIEAMERVGWLEQIVIESEKHGRRQRNIKYKIQRVCIATDWSTLSRISITSGQCDDLTLVRASKRR